MLKTRQYKICKKLVMDTSDPSITFDSNGVSNHFYNFHNRIKRNWFPNEIGHQRIRKLINEIRREGESEEFDCILGLSGGLDSSYLLHLAVVEFKLRPLVFHVDAGWNSDIAVRNINSLVSKLNLDLYTEVLDWDTVRNFQLAMFKAGVPHLDIPQDHAFVSVLYKFAVQNNIKYILNGGNIATESITPPLEFLYWGTDLWQINDILKKHSEQPIDNYPFSSALYHKGYLRLIKGLKVIKPLNFVSYDKKIAAEELKKKYGWVDYGQKHFESRFTRFFESYWLPTRFGFDMRRPQLSSLILSEQITRDEALEELKRETYDPGSLKRDLEYVATKLGISSSELMDFHNLPKKYYWDYKNQKFLFDIGEKLLSILYGTQRGGAY
jgi:N-acetyl sugar amidotransferase